MKKIYPLFLSVAFLFGCQRNDGSITPAAGSPLGVTQTFGTTNGEAGGPCDLVVSKDYEISQESCKSDEATPDLSPLLGCLKAFGDFAKIHQNVDCTYADGDELIAIKTSPSRISAEPKGICDKRIEEMRYLREMSRDKKNQDEVHGKLNEFRKTYENTNCKGTSNEDFSKELTKSPQN